MSTKYEKCKKKVINSVLKSYEKKGTITKKQSIAIALQISEKKCEKLINTDDYKKMEEKIDRMINKEKIQQTGMNNTLKLINYYKKEKKYFKGTKLENKMLRYIIKSLISNINNVNKNNKDINTKSKSKSKVNKKNKKSKENITFSKNIKIITSFIKSLNKT